jgi:Lhr-like helicase
MSEPYTRSQPYVKFNDIKFLNRQHKNLCKLLHKQIREMEDDLMAEEECHNFLKNVNEEAARISHRAIENNRKILFAMKLVFWYYTGCNSTHVLDEDKYVDIFSLV